MQVTQQQETRERMAHREIGATDISRRGAWILIGIFLVMISLAPLFQHVAEWREARLTNIAYQPTSLALANQLPTLLSPLAEQGVRLSSLLEANRQLLGAIQAHEDRLDDESKLGIWIRPRMQVLFANHLGVGNEQAYVGRKGWLFFRPGIDYLIGPGFLNPRQLARRAASGSEWQAAPHPNPLHAILDFHQQLQERGIQLILVPTPIKASIHPEMFSARFAASDTSLQNASYAEFIETLESAGVQVFDPSHLLIDRRLASASPQYLATDTHWLPDAMEATATALAERIRPHLSGPEEGLTRSHETVTAHGDIAFMLKLSPDTTAFPAETVSIRPVLSADGQYWRASQNAEVLVLGDSFSNIYSLEPMGWGQSAGFVEQLAYHLQAPVDRLVRNDAGAFATRDMLARELARGRDRLAGKKWLIWQFAARELAVGDWKLTSLTLGEPSPATFLEMSEGESRLVTGVVQSTSWVPRPGSVPYRDHVLSLHLVDLPDQAQAVVYMFSMQDNVWTRAASLQPGDEIKIKVSAWSEVADQYDALNRSELDDVQLQLEEPVWGEWWE